MANITKTNIKKSVDKVPPSDVMAVHLRDGVAAIRQPFCVYGADEKLAAYNHAFADLHRRADDSCLLYPGIPFQEIMEWRREAGFFAEMPQHECDGAESKYKLPIGDVIYQLADGRWMFVDNMRLPDGRLACTWNDITAIKQAERQLWELTQTLHRSRDHLYYAQRVAHVGSVEYDLRTGIVSWTPETYEIFGRDPALPPPCFEDVPKLFHPEDRSRFRATIAFDPNPPGEFRVLRPDGSIRWVRREAELIRDEAGKPRLRIGTYRDVTEIHDYQEKQKALQAELLARERLSAIGSVTERLARELRDPLSTINYSLFLINGEEGSRTVSANRALGRIERSTARCNQIISDLLEYSHSEPLRCRAHEIDDWLREVVISFAAEPALTFELDLKAPGTVEIDPGRLRRALGHLVENAIEAASEEHEGRSPGVTLQTRLEDGYAKIAVIDNGRGIAKEVLDRAFDPLFSTKPLGTGLGLTTARQIVEQHGGTVELTSDASQGAVALIRLPLAGAAASTGDADIAVAA
jgi:PAS domain S-box-containing protein